MYFSTVELSTTASPCVNSFLLLLIILKTGSVMLLRASLRQPLCHFIWKRTKITSSVNYIKALVSEDCLEIEWNDGHKSRFHNSWLRFSCQCEHCKQSHSGQRTIDTLSIPEPLEISDFSLSKNKENLEVKWENERDHQGVLNLQWLRENCYSEVARKLDNKRRITQPHIGEHSLPEVEYSTIMESREGLWKMLSQLSDHGVSLVKNVPHDDEENVLKVGRLIGPIQETIYGKMFDVVSTPNPINIAYSSVGLSYHIDLAYYESPPGLQLLHCLRFDSDIEGGESLFLDAFYVAEEFRKQFPKEFDDLVRIPGTFQKIHFERDYPVKLVYKRPHIVLSPDKEIVAVTWAPPFEGPLSVPEEDVEPYYRAYRLFSKLMEESPLQKSVRLHQGDLVCFNNRRILHGRNSFNLNGGVRHFKGAYVNIDEFRNAFQVTSELVGSGEPCRRSGNHCFL
nr:gamma-butyrobetaine dioxygenase-like isoform X1 [Pocillopora verrucosa]